MQRHHAIPFHFFGQARVRQGLLGAWLALGCTFGALALDAQAVAGPTSTAPRSGASAPSAPVKSAVATSAGPQWSDLNPSQQQALKPLAGKWNSLSEAQRRKWIALAQNYGSMTPAEQSKLQSRMTEWASLSMQQRDQARVNFAQAKAIPADERQEKWRKYQELSAAEKAALASKAKATPKGAAPAIKPAASSQLTVVTKRPRSHSSAASHGSAPLPARGASTTPPAASSAPVTSASAGQ